MTPLSGDQNGIIFEEFSMLIINYNKFLFIEIYMKKLTILIW